MENKPSHYVYYVTETNQQTAEEKSDFWTKVGAAWPHKDGKGFSISVAALPFNGRLVLREPRDEEQVLPIEAEVAAAQ